VIGKIAAVLAALLCAAAARAETISARDAVLSYSVDDELIYFTNENIGADAFYSNGVYGAGAKIANIELGIYWGGHAAFSNTVLGAVKVPDGVSAESLYSSHATSTAAVAAGYKQPQAGVDPDIFIYAAFGVAPAATLSAGAVARTINPDGAASSLEVRDVCGVYKYFFSENPQDVINSSWGPISEEPGGYLAAFADGLLCENPLETLVISAGNKIDGQLARPTTFAQSYNAIAVGALGNVPRYDAVADFSVRAPSDFFNPTTGELVENARASIDICAPGVNVFTAVYDASDPSLTEEYSAASGTSFSAPIVAGTAALMVSLSKSLEGNPSFVAAGWSSDARDSRVIKAVLMNSADKPAGWDNGQSLQNGVEFKIEVGGISGAYMTQTYDGIVATSQGLDYNFGAGALNAERALEQYVGMYTSGTADNVWLLDSVDFCASKLYNLGKIDAGRILNLTLVWQALYELAAEAGEDGSYAIEAAALADLSLEIWIRLSEDVFQPVAISDCKYNNVEHLTVTLAGVADYYARVAFFGMAYGELPNETFALAWSVVPEPAKTALLAALLILAAAIRRSAKRRH